MGREGGLPDRRCETKQAKATEAMEDAEDAKDTEGCEASRGLLRLEIYEAADPSHGAEPLAGFEAEALGVIRVDLQKLLLQDRQTVVEGSMALDAQGAASRGCGGDVACAAFVWGGEAAAAGGAQRSWRYTREHWIHGVMCGVDGARGDHTGRGSGDLVVAARIEAVAWPPRGQGEMMR